MAEGTKLNYQLPQDVLDRVSRTTESDITNKLRLGDAASEIGQGINTVLEDAHKVKKKEAEAELLEREEALESYQKGLDERGSRKNFHTPSTYDQIQAIEIEKQEEFRNASKADQTKMLTEQATRGDSFSRNKEIIELARVHADAKDVDESTLSAEQLHMFGQIVAQKGTEVTLNKDNEYEWLYRPLGWEEGDDEGLWNVASARDVEKIIEGNLKPYDETLQFGKALTNVKKSAKKDAFYDDSIVYNTASDLINGNNISQLMNNGDVWGTRGESFADHFLEWKGFDGMKLNLDYSPTSDISAFDTDGDGVLTEVELSKADRQAVVKMLGEPDNYELARELLLEYAVERGRQQYNKFKPVEKTDSKDPVIDKEEKEEKWDVPYDGGYRRDENTVNTDFED